MKLTDHATIEPGRPFDEYNADPTPEPSLRSGLIRTLIDQSPLHAWTECPRLNPNFVEKHEEKFDLGTAAHELVVGGEDSIVVCDFKDWRTDAAKEMRDAARAADKTPILAKHMERIRAMADLLHFDDIFRGGHPEVTMTWKEDVWFRIRPDWLPELKAPSMIYDYKTGGVSANPAVVSRHAYSCGWDIQAALIVRGAKACLDCDVEVEFVYQENFPPHATTKIGISRYGLALAEREIDRAAKLWRRCLDTGDWPGYTDETVYADPPDYHVVQREERAEMPYDWSPALQAKRKDATS